MIQNPPRNGEVARRRRDGGVETPPRTLSHKTIANGPFAPAGHLPVPGRIG